MITTDLYITIIPGKNFGNFEGTTAIVIPKTERAKKYMSMYPKTEDRYEFFASSWADDIKRGYVMSHDLTEQYTIKADD